ncbi:MAG TPA: DUF2017 family protein [Actinomycetota bacterium]|nr:DUF2017 family protein [Actinomycetota bacterium]
MPRVFPLDGTSVAIALEADEREAMRRLVGEMRTFLTAEIPRQDAVRARLFPNAYEDEESEAGYREMVEADLEQAKRAALDTVAQTLGDQDEDLEVALLPNEVQAWLTLLTDLRLSLGTRLEVTEEKMSAEIDAADPDGPAYAMLDWLGWFQESMLRYLDPEKQRLQEE